MSRAAVIAALVVLVAADAARAQPLGKPSVDLRLKRRPLRHLRMREPVRVPRVAQSQTSPPPASRAAVGDSTSVAVTAQRPTDLDVAGIRSADEKIVFRLDLGFGVDGGTLSGRRALAGETLDASDYRQVRAQGFGNLFVGTRGLLITPLSSYLSAGFRLTPSLGQIAPLADALDSTDDVQIRASWAEASDFLPGRVLAPLRVRAGRQYVYGPWPVHFDGTVFGWSGRGLKIDLFAGSRVPDYAPTGEAGSIGQTVIGGVIASFDLSVSRKIPIIARWAAMQYGDRQLAELELGYIPRRGLSVIGGVRWLEGDLARERATARVQISEVTYLVIEAEHRRETDWRWDPSFVESGDLPTDPSGARAYLELGPVPRQLRGAIRAGTVLLDNIDLYVRGAAAIDLGDRPDERTGFAEIGTAFEVRVRRTLALYASGSIRDYELTDAEGPGKPSYDQLDVANTAQPLLYIEDPDIRSVFGEEYFIEGGAGIRLSTGARRLSVSAEGYARRNRFALLYDEPTPASGDLIDRYDTRTGGRFSVDGWMTKRLRIHLEYDLSSQLERAPEITGWKTLRALVEGSF